MSKVYKTLAVLLLALGFFAVSGEMDEVMAARKKSSQSFFKKAARKMKRNIKKACKKTKRSFVKAGSAVTNKIMDGAVKAKSKLTGKKAKKTWVKGHYKKGSKSHTKGHFRKVSKKGGKKSSSSGSSSSSAPAVSGQPLPPSQDPVLPNFNRSKR
ncbi:MAG: hypothetical protein CVV42_03885 [Candidatus Riflebacteria bacterium HGW-Riflebacteria-2]|jgi:hypothetical protein|nr:MAG: hypothetical protein CVV42_03885 [Candidatus Riflebacteria bacterium HGW-Riflebacteria-2]